MSARASLKRVWILAALAVAATVGSIGATALAAPAATAAKPAISEDVSAAIAQMGKTLQADQFAFQARTLRVYVERDGQALHVAHTIDVLVHRPDRLAVAVDGDDGSTKLFYDGKTVTLFGVDDKKYWSTPVPNTIEGMLKTVTAKFGVDFPLADFLTDAPDKSFLSGVTSGREVNTVTIDGTPCRHLLFMQPPGITLELWIEKNDKALPRRLIVTYGSLPGQPSYIVEFTKWDFSVHPTDADFTFQPPAGATQIELKPPAAAAATAKPKGAKP
jgi:hypothetical protein